MRGTQTATDFEAITFWQQHVEHNNVIVIDRGLIERGFTVFRSDANFVLTKPPVDAARLAALNWPQTTLDGQCVALDPSYSGHPFALWLDGASPPSEGHACFYGSTGDFRGCSTTLVPLGSRYFSVSSPDGVLVTWRLALT